MKAFRKTKVDRALRRSMLTNGGEAALILASRVERTIHLIQRDVTGTARVTNKLNTIIIPRVEFRDASIREAKKPSCAASPPCRRTILP